MRKWDPDPKPKPKPEPEPGPEEPAVVFCELCGDRILAEEAVRIFVWHGQAYLCPECYEEEVL